MSQAEPVGGKQGSSAPSITWTPVTEPAPSHTEAGHLPVKKRKWIVGERQLSRTEPCHPCEVPRVPFPWSVGSSGSLGCVHFLGHNRAPGTEWLKPVTLPASQQEARSRQARAAGRAPLNSGVLPGLSPGLRWGRQSLAFLGLRQLPSNQPSDPAASFLGCLVAKSPLSCEGLKVTLTWRPAS